MAGPRKTAAQKAAAAKKSPAKKTAAAAPSNPRMEKWARSICAVEDLERLVRWGALPDQATANWHATSGFAFPTPDTRQLVLFYHHVSRGLGVPVHYFVRDLLDYWGIRLVHLAPNAILHLSIFIHWCEAFLGIDPHFNLFISLFTLELSPSSDGPKAVGACFLRLRDKSRYLDVPLRSSIKDWNQKWFLIDNAPPSVDNDVDSVPIPLPTWTAKPLGGDRDQVEELMEIFH